MKNKIRVGIIGVSPDRGWAAIAHIAALKALPEYEIKAISNRNEDKAIAAAKAFDIPLIFTGNSKLINSNEIDLVVITVKVPEHYKLVAEAINAGKSVYCEWPLGNGLEETIALAALAKKQGVPNAIGLQSRAVPAINYLKDLIAEGYIGEVLSTSMIGSGIIYGALTEQAMAYTVDAKNGAGMIYATFGHAADTLTYVLGEFKEINATAVNRRTSTKIVETNEDIPMTAFDQIVVNGLLKSGAVASIHYRGGMFKGTNFLWEINGTKGDLVVTSDIGHPAVMELTIKGSQGNDGALEVLPIPKKYNPITTTDLITPAFNVAQHYKRLATDLNEGTRLSATFDDAVIRHQMINAIEIAATTGIRQSY